MHAGHRVARIGNVIDEIVAVADAQPRPRDLRMRGVAGVGMTHAHASASHTELCARDLRAHCFCRPLARKRTGQMDIIAAA